MLCYCSLEVFLFSVVMVFTEAFEYEDPPLLNRGVGSYLLASSCSDNWQKWGRSRGHQGWLETAGTRHTALLSTHVSSGCLDKEGWLQAPQLWPAPREQGNLAQVPFCWQTTFLHKQLLCCSTSIQAMGFVTGQVCLNLHLNSCPDPFSSPNLPIINSANAPPHIQMCVSLMGWSMLEWDRRLLAAECIKQVHMPICHPPPDLEAGFFWELPCAFN